jgi:H2-forming N5,N10-methylenetetrahydromethanopterin dehydrogenase-like enzyme
MKEGSDGKPIKVLRDDLHASDMVRLVQLGLQTEYRAKTALEKMHPAGTPGTPTGDNPDVKPQGQTPEEQNAVALNDELAAMREALKDPKKSEAAFQFVKALGLKSE